MLSDKARQSKALDQLVTPDVGRKPFDRKLNLEMTEGIVCHHQSVIDPIHDACLTAFQKFLDALNGQACSSLEENRSVVHQVAGLAKRYGVCLFYKTPSGETHNVRLGIAAGNQANRAGYFVVIETGGESKPITRVALFPKLIAARDQAQAETINGGLH